MFKKLFLSITIAFTGILLYAQDGALDLSFDPGTGANNNIYTTAIQSDGKIIIGGTFTSYNGTSIIRIARLNTDGTLDATFNSAGGTDQGVEKCAVQSDGKIIIVGGFTSYNGTSRNGIARLNSDGSLDPSFDPGNGANNDVRSIAIQSDGKIIIVGDFTSYDGTSISRIARLNTDGSIDNTFSPGTGASHGIRATTIQSDGKIIIGGGFSSYNGTSRNCIARINTDGTLDATFNPGTGANVTVSSLAIQGDGKIIIGGHFTSYNGISRARIARINMDGTLDLSFNPGTGADNTVVTINLQSDGKIIIGGVFISYNGSSINRIARLNVDGSLDNNFNPGTGADDIILGVTIQNDDKIIIGGRFNSYNGTSRNHIARIISCNPVSQPSAISGSTDLCNGDTETYSVTNDPNADTYNWTLPSGFSGTSTTNSINVTAGSTGGTIEVTATNACGTSTVQTIVVNVNDVPAQPSTINGNNNLCAGDVETYSVTNDPNADNYNWTLPSGWSGTSTSNSINATSGSTGGTIEVTAENACGASNPQTIAITVDDVPAQPGTISGDDVVCEGSEQNYGITSVSGATDYTWSLPGGWSGTSTTNMITTTVSTLGGNLTVTANNACGSSTPETLSITVNELPTVTYDQDPAFACVYHDAFTLGSASPSGGTFSGTGVSGNDFDPGTADIGTHDITYTYTDGNGCTNEVTQQIEVDGCVGLKDQENQSMTVYPNPFDEAFTIEFNKSGNHTVELLNSLGQIITTVRTEEQSTQISTTDLSPGVYYVRVVEDNSSFKVVKK